MAATGPYLLLDIDGVLHVGDEPVEGALEALPRLREQAADMRLVTNTTSKPRRAIVSHLRQIGFEVEPGEVLTPAAMAVHHCRERGYERVSLFVSEELRDDLSELEAGSGEEGADALVLGDLGSGFNAETLNRAFRLLIGGAELVALQHNRYWQRPDGLVLDVGAYAAALEYASGKESVVVGKPAAPFFRAALADMQAAAEDALMIGDDVEADVGGALEAGLGGILVRTGKYREEAVAASGVEPTATISSIAALPALLDELPSSSG